MSRHPSGGRRAPAWALIAGFGLVALAGCSDNSSDAARQGPAGKTVTRDTKPWDSAPTTFSTGQFKKGDKEGWQEALRERAQAQNEYAKSR